MEDKLEITGSSGYKTEITISGNYMASDDYNLKSVNYMALLSEDYLLTLRSEGSVRLTDRERISLHSCYLILITKPII